MQLMPRLKLDGVSPYSAGASTNLSAAKQALFDLLSPYVPTGEVCWYEIDRLPQHDDYQSSLAPGALRPRLYLGGTRAVIPAQFRWICRMTGRELGVGAAAAVPWITEDELTGKPIMMSGEGGVFPNLMPDIGSDLICPSQKNAAGDELNNTDFFSPGGWTIATVVRIPPLGGTINGTLFPTIAGGALMGGSSITGDNNFDYYWDIGGLPGRFRARNRNGINGWEGSVDMRTGAVLKLMTSYTTATDTYQHYENGVDMGTFNSPITPTDIINTDADARKLHVFAMRSVPASAVFFFGACACIIRAPAALLASSANRAIFSTYMDEVA